MQGALPLALRKLQQHYNERQVLFPPPLSYCMLPSNFLYLDWIKHGGEDVSPVSQTTRVAQYSSKLSPRQWGLPLCCSINTYFHVKNNLSIMFLENKLVRSSLVYQFKSLILDMQYQLMLTYFFTKYRLDQEIQKERIRSRLIKPKYRQSLR